MSVPFYQTVYAVASKTDGSVIALYTTRELAEQRLQRVYQRHLCHVVVMHVFDND